MPAATGSFCLGLMLSCLLPTPAAAQEPDSLAARAGRLFQRWDSLTTPGCAAAVDSGGTVRFSRAYGAADLESGRTNTPETVFLAASLAKQFTAMSVLLLERDGRLSLDYDVRTFLPELPDYGVRITLRHLLTHTSGLRDFFEMLILARGRFEENRITRADLFDIVTRQRRLNFRPGDEYLYSNTGYALLALVVERVSGQTLAGFTQTRIFGPLGMAHTRFVNEFTAVIPGRAGGYDQTADGWRRSFPNYDVVGSTNLYTTTGDLLTWGRNLIHPVVGDAELVKAMTSRAMLTNGDSLYYGFGLGLWNDRGRRVVEHEGSDPGYRAFFGQYPDQGVTVAVLCNTRSANAVALGHDLIWIYLPRLEEPKSESRSLPAAAMDPALQAQKAGVYFQPTLVGTEELGWHDGALWTRPQGGRRLLPVGRDSFQIEGQPLLYLFGAAPNAGFTLVWLTGERHPILYTRPAPFDWSKGLKQYTGRYHSEELNADYVVSAKDSTLELSTGTSTPLVFSPSFRDTFESGQLMLEFRRVGQRYKGFLLSHPRTRRLAFIRTRR